VLRCVVALEKFRPSATTVLVAVLAWLPVLAVAQYRWFGQISENQRGRLQHALINAMSGVARDLYTAVAGAVGQLDVEGLVSGVASRTGVPAPRLVSEVLHGQRPAGHDARLTLTRCDVRARSCSVAEWPLNSPNRVRRPHAAPTAWQNSRWNSSPACLTNCGRVSPRFTQPRRISPMAP